MEMISNCIYRSNVQKEIILVPRVRNCVVHLRILHTTYGHLTSYTPYTKDQKVKKANLTVMIPIIKGKLVATIMKARRTLSGTQEIF